MSRKTNVTFCLIYLKINRTSSKYLTPFAIFFSTFVHFGFEKSNVTSGMSQISNHWLEIVFQNSGSQNFNPSNLTRFSIRIRLPLRRTSLGLTSKFENTFFKQWLEI